MGTYTDQQVFAFGESPVSRRVSFDIDSGASAVIESRNGTGWVVTDTVTASDGVEVFTQNTNIRITPTGTVSYDIDESGRTN